MSILYAIGTAITAYIVVYTVLSIPVTVAAVVSIYNYRKQCC
jgi:hypothetical protein